MIPIFKAGENKKIGNYRPVSLLTTVSKVFERVFFTRLSSFLITQKVLYELQFGFREGHATHMAVIKLLDTIITSLEKGELAMGLFLDFSKAFDTVNHVILIQKLEHYGVRGMASNWIESYLNNRKQYCTYDSKKSKTRNITCGVPQGSILGPLLFLVYINDLGHIFNNFRPILFADDSNLIIKGRNLTEIERKFNLEIPVLVNWLQTNRLSLNLTKTHYMIFGSKKANFPHEINLEIEGIKIEEVKETKFLGVILENTLSWNSHISYIAKKIAKSVGILTRARQMLNK